MPIRITQLPTATSVGGEEFIIIVQNGITKKITIGETLFEGVQGPAGTGYVFKGNWSSVTGYVVNDVVVYNGSSYVSKTNNNVNHTPGDNTYWGVVALKGDTGATGPAGVGSQGPQGAQGPQGPAGSLDLESTVTNNYPDVKPTIDLNFEHQQLLDPRVTLTRDCEATYYDEYGTLKIAASNEPVFDRDPNTGESKGLYIAGPSTDLLFSDRKNEFSTWTLTDTSVVSNIAVAPDGTLTADQLIEGTGTAGKGASHGATFPVTNRKSYTFSTFVKKGIRATAPNIIQLGYPSQFGTNAYANFDILNGKVLRQGYSITDAKIIKLPNGWFRISITADCTSSNNGSTGGNIIFANNNAMAGLSTSYTGSTTSDVLVWGPQLEEGASLTPYKHNTNGILYAQALQSWTLTNVTSTVNFAYAPDDTFTAERIVETTTNGQHLLLRTGGTLQTFASGQIATVVIYAKKGSGSSAPDNFHFRPSTASYFANGWGANFNIASGVVNSVQGNATGLIESVGDGWYKCIVHAIATTSNVFAPAVVLVNNNPNENSAVTYAGSSNSDIFLWGLHAVIGYNVPEYIRNPEIATINTTNKLPLLEGTIVAKAEVTQEQSVVTINNIIQKNHYLFDAKSGNNRVSLYARKPNNLLMDSSAFIDRNLLRGSEGDNATWTFGSPAPSLVKDGIAGFENSFQFPPSAAQIAKSFSPNPFASGDIATFSFFIQMDDGGAPVLASSSTDASGDFVFLLESSLTMTSAAFLTQNVSGSLYRCSVTKPMTGTGTTHGVYKYNTNSIRGFKVTGFQLEYGNLTAYQKTDYITSTVTNRWATINTKIMPEQIAAPTGGVFGDRIIETAASGVHNVYNLVFAPKEQHTYLYSMYLKKGVGVSAPDIMRLTTSRSGVYSSNWADFNIASGTVAFSTGCVASVQDAGNGWYRCLMQFDTPEGKASQGIEQQNYIYLSFTNNTAGTGYISSSAYTGSVDSDVFAWGAQLQEYAYSDPASGTLLPYEDGGAPIYTAEITDASGNITRAEYQTALSDGIHKFGMAWNSSGLSLFLDGAKVAQRTTPLTLTSMPSTSNLGSDNNNKSQWGGTIQRLSIYPRKLDDVVIQAITE